MPIKKISFIAPLRNLDFNVHNWNMPVLNYVFDEKYNIVLKPFSYHDDIEPIHADSFSTIKQFNNRQFPGFVVNLKFQIHL